MPANITGTSSLGKGSKSVGGDFSVGGDLYVAGDTITTDDITVNEITADQITMTAGANVVLNATTGTKIGTATTQKLGFYNATAIVQPSAYTQTYSTANKTVAAPTATTLTVADGAGTNDGTIGAITADASVIAAVQELAAAVNALIADDLDNRQTVTALIDDLQALGLVG